MQKVIYFKNYRFDALWTFIVGAILFAISFRFKIGVLYFDYWFLICSAIYLLCSHRKYLAFGEDGLVYFSGVLNQGKLTIKWSQILSVNLKKFKRKYSISAGARDYTPGVGDEDVPCIQIKLEPNFFETIKREFTISKKHIRLNDDNSSIDLWDSDHFDLENIMVLIEKHTAVQRNDVQLGAFKTNWFGKIILFVFWIFLIVKSVLWASWWIKNYFA